MLISASCREVMQGSSMHYSVPKCVLLPRVSTFNQKAFFETHLLIIITISQRWSVLCGRRCSFYIMSVLYNNINKYMQLLADRLDKKISYSHFKKTEGQNNGENGAAVFIEFAALIYLFSI